MKYIFPVLILIGCVIQIHFLGNAATTFAHYHIDWVCESGNKLASEASNIDEATRFQELCRETEEHSSRIAQATIKAVIYNGVILLLFIVMAAVQIFWSLKQSTHNKAKLLKPYVGEDE